MYFLLFFPSFCVEFPQYGIVSGGPPMVTGEDGCIAGDGTNVNGEGLWLFSKDPQPEEGTLQVRTLSPLLSRRDLFEIKILS